MNFCKRLRQMREKRYSQEEIAEKVNVSTLTISRWENGLQKPRPKKVAELARILGTTPEYLLGDTDNPESTAQPVQIELFKQEGATQQLLTDNNTLYFKNEAYEIRVPNDEENRKIFWAVVSNAGQQGGIDASVHILNGGQGNYHGNVITTK